MTSPAPPAHDRLLNRRSLGALLARAARAPSFAGVVAFLLLYAACAARYHDRGFVSPQVFINLLADNSFLGIVAVGMTLVIISGGIDLSVGAVMGLSSITLSTLLAGHVAGADASQSAGPAWALAAAVPAVLALGATIGLAQGALIQFLALPPFIATLAGMFFARGLAFLVQLEPVNIENAQHATLAALRIPLGPLGAFPITGAIFLATVLAGAFIANRTALGRGAYAVGGSEDAALLMGLPVARTRLAVYSLSGLCAALAGVVLTLYQGSGSHSEGVGLELDAIAAVVIGGTLLTGGVGNMLGTFIGVLIIGLILTVTTFEGTLTSGCTKVLIGLLLLLFVLLQKLFARAARAP
jgi:ribose/xylose/arabinose/galactoside ABC-type transport system permease subunit